MQESNRDDASAMEEKIMEQIDKDIARLRMRESMRLELESAPVNSALADHQSLGVVLDALSNQVRRLRQNVEVIKNQPADDHHETFGGGFGLTAV